MELPADARRDPRRGAGDVAGGRRRPGPPRPAAAAHGGAPASASARAPASTSCGGSIARFEALSPPPDLYLSIVVPEGEGADWIDGPVLRNASSIAGVRVVLDPGGRFAARLGATTSGHVLVYGADDALLFSGGITAARAHEGDAPGQNAIVRALYGKTPPIHRSAVFGCGLRSPAVKG